MNSGSLRVACGGYGAKAPSLAPRPVGNGPEAVSWVLIDSSGAHHVLSPVIKLGIHHPRKKERKKVGPIVADRR